MILYQLDFGGGKIIDNSSIFGNLSYTHEINNNEDFCLGTTSSAEVSFETNALTTQNIGDEFTLKIKQFSQTYYRNFGKFVIKEVTKYKTRYKVTAYDYICKFDKDVSSWITSVPVGTSLGDIFNGLCSQCGVTPFGTVFTNSTYHIATPITGNNISGRTVLSYIAQAAGGAAISNNTGLIKIIDYVTNPDTITNAEYKTFDYADYSCAAIGQVRICKADGSTGAVYPGTGANSLKIIGNPLLYTSTTTTALTEVATNIYNQIHGYSNYTPATISLIEDYDIDVGDILTVENKKILVMKKQLDNAGVTISCTGSYERSLLVSEMERINEVNGQIEIIRTEGEETLTEIHDARGSYGSLALRFNAIEAAVAEAGNHTYMQSTEPTDAKEGDIWIYTGTTTLTRKYGKMYRKGSSGWSVVTDSDITVNGNAIAQLQIDVGGISSTVQGHTTNINTLNGTVATHTSDISSINQTMSGISSTVSSHTQSINALSGTVSQHSSSISTIQQTANSVSAEVTTARGTYSNLNARLNDIVVTGSGNKTYKQAAAPTGDIRSGDLWFDTTTSKWKRYNGTSWDVMTDGDIASVVEETARLSVEVGNISSTVSSHTTDINTLNGTVASHSTSISQIDQKADSIDLRVESIEDDYVTTDDIAGNKLVASINLQPSTVQIDAKNINLNGVTTFVKPADLSSTGTTVIDGGRIQTGVLKSSNYVGPGPGELYSQKGSYINLSTGEIITPGLHAYSQPSSGKNAVRIKGVVEAESGKLGDYFSIDPKGIIYNTSSAGTHFRTTVKDVGTPYSLDVDISAGDNGGYNTAKLHMYDNNGEIRGDLQGNWYVFTRPLHTSWIRPHWINLAEFIDKVWDEMGWPEPTD